MGGAVTREDILRLADKAGMMPFAMTPRCQSQLAKQLGEFAALVAAHEREACAKVCERFWSAASLESDRTATAIAAAIRKRGKVKP